MKKKGHAKPAAPTEASAYDWRSQCEVLFVAAREDYQQKLQEFLQLAHIDPLQALVQQSVTLIQAQVVQQEMETVHQLVDEAGTPLQALQAVQRWTTDTTVNAVADFSASFPSDLIGTAKETAVSYRLQFLQVNTSPLNRLLKILQSNR